MVVSTCLEKIVCRDVLWHVQLRTFQNIMKNETKSCLFSFEIAFDFLAMMFGCVQKSLVKLEYASLGHSAGWWFECIGVLALVLVRGYLWSRGRKIDACEKISILINKGSCFPRNSTNNNVEWWSRMSGKNLCLEIYCDLCNRKTIKTYCKWREMKIFILVQHVLRRLRNSVWMLSEVFWIEQMIK